jgi:protoporphyrinogen oxidase
VKLGIIGGGVLGLTVALRRVQAGDEVIIFEKSQEPGGLAASFPVTDRPDGPYLEKFYHHIFQTDKDIVRLIDELGLTEQLEWKTPPTSTFRNGKVYRMDSAFDELKIQPLKKVLRPLTGSAIDTAVAIMRFKPISIIDRLRFGLGGGYLKFESNYGRLEGTTAAKWARKWLGKGAYEAILKPLLTAKFGAKYDQIAMSWLWSRFHERTQFLGYIRGGFHKLYMKLYDTVQAKGGQIKLGANVTGIKAAENGKVLVCADGQEYVFDKVVVTAPTRIFTQIAKDTLPKEYIERYTGSNSVEHYNAHCVILSLDRKFMDTYWLNLNDPGFPFLALVEHTSYMPTSDYDGQHLLYLGNYLPPDHPLFSKSDEEVLKEFLPHLKRINPDFDESWVKKSWVWKAPYAQPIVTIGYKDKLPPHQTPIPNVLLANMAHVYPQDRGQNYSIKLGEKIAKML